MNSSMLTQCAVLGCKNEKRKGRVSDWKFFSFPKDEEVLQKWLEFCERDEINLDTDCICDEHFVSQDYERDLKFEMGFSKKRIWTLTSTAVPTIRPAKPDPIVEETPEKEDSIDSSDENYGVEFIAVTGDFDNSTSKKKKAASISLILDPNSPEGLKEEISRLEKENAALKKTIKKHENDIKGLNMSIAKSEGQRMELEKNLRLVFSEGQVKKLKCGKDRRTTWDEEDVVKATELYSISTKAYDWLLKNQYPVPSVRTIQLWAHLGKSTHDVLNEETGLFESSPNVCSIRKRAPKRKKGERPPTPKKTKRKRKSKTIDESHENSLQEFVEEDNVDESYEAIIEEGMEECIEDSIEDAIIFEI